MARALWLRRIMGLSALGTVVTATGACSHDFDTSRQLPKRGSIGEELYGVLCDRVGAQALHEDLTGDSFRLLCHKGADGLYQDKVDTTRLPVPTAGLRNPQGTEVPLEEQQRNRTRAIERIETLARHRAELIAALDATFPERNVPVKDNKGKDPKKSCDPRPGKISEAKLSDELADMLGRFQALYNDGTIPQSTQSLGRVMNSFKASPEAQAAWARMDARQGYRPIDVVLGAARPMIAYPHLRDLSNATLRLLSADSEPYALEPKLDEEGNRIPIPGPAHAQFSKMLEVAHHEMRTVQADPPLKPLTMVARKIDAAEPGLDTFEDLARREVLSRPRSNLEAMAYLFYKENAAFGGGTDRFIVKRDERGYALVNGPVVAPFLDTDKDGLADVDELGRFKTADGKPAPTPFFTVGYAFGNRDPKTGLAINAQGQPLYASIRTNKTFTASLLQDLKPLVDPGKETLMRAVSGAYVVFGGRAPVTREFAPDPSAVDDWKATHTEPPPADLAARKVQLEYNGFRADDSPLLDLVYALGQMLGDKSTDEALVLVRELMTKHEADVARVAGDALYAREVAAKYPQAQIPRTSTLWDEMIDVTIAIAKEPGLLEDLLRALGNDDTKLLTQAFSDYLAYKDRISYDRDNLNGPARNMTTGVKDGAFATKVDRNAPDTGPNRSAFQRFLQAIHDTNGVTACNKEGARVHAKGIPIAGSLTLPLFGGTYKECEVFKIENLAKFYTQSIIGKASLYFRPDILRNGIVGIGAATVDTIEQSSGITGFYDGGGSRTFRPRPQWLNRLVNYDINETPNATTAIFIRDLQGDKIGTSVCPERVIPDPSPGSPDASSDGLVRGLRNCPNGEWLFQRDQDATMVWEKSGFYRGIAPLVKAFADHNREDLFLATMEVLHKHWQSDKGTAGECKLGPGKTCTKAGAVSYEGLLSEVFASDILSALNALTKTLTTVTVPRCAQVDATKKCTRLATPAPDGISVLAEATRALVDPERAKGKGLKDRFGKVTSERNDKSTNAQVTPLYLILQALNAIDDQFEAYAQANPQDSKRQEEWRSARSQLVDQFLDVNGKNTANSSFKNVAVVKIAPQLIDLLRAQLYAHCPDSMVPPYAKCKWATEDFPKNVEKVVSGPMFASAIDLMDAIRRDEQARIQLELLLGYLVDAASQNEALNSMLASAADLVQALKDDTNLVPLFRVLADATKGSLIDTKGRTVQKSLVDAQLSLLAKISGKAYDAEGVEICSRELDPNEVLSVALANLVTPMTDADGKPTRTPLEVIMDVIAAVNRAEAKPDNQEKLQASDYASIADHVSSFLLDKERGLEQFYEIVRQGTVKE